MAGKRNGLGKGLDSLIPNKTVKEESASQQKVSKEKQEKLHNGEGENNLADVTYLLDVMLKDIKNRQ